MQAVCDLMLECLHQDPAKRPTALELLQRLGRLVGPPTHASRAASSGGSPAGGGPAGGLPRPLMRVAVPQPGLPSPFAAMAAFAPASEQQQQQQAAAE